MAFQTQEPVPYYRAPAPEVPVAPKMPQGDLLGGNIIAAFTQRAIAAERAQLEQQQMIQHADIAAKQLQLDRDRLGQNYDLTTKDQAIREKNVDLDYQVKDRSLDLEENLNQHRANNLDALTDYHKSQSKLYGSALGRNIEFAKQTADMLDEAGKDADAMQLYDPKFQTEHPMEFAKNAYAFEQMYGATVEPRLKATIKEFIAKAEASKVKLPGLNGAPTEYSWAQVARDIATNGDNSPFVDALQKANMFTRTSSEELTKSGRPVTSTLAPKPQLRTILQDAKIANFGGLKDIKSKIQPFGAKNATEAIASGQLDLGVQRSPAATTKAGQLNPGAALPPPDKTMVEAEADFVKSKMAADPDNAEAYKQRFLQLNPGQDALLQ